MGELYSSSSDSDDQANRQLNSQPGVATPTFHSAPTTPVAVTAPRQVGEFGGEEEGQGEEGGDEGLEEEEGTAGSEFIFAYGMYGIKRIRAASIGSLPASSVDDPSPFVPPSQYIARLDASKGLGINLQITGVKVRVGGFAPAANGAMSAAQLSGIISVGDVLLGVNGRDLTLMRFNDILGVLRALPRIKEGTVTLRFAYGQEEQLLLEAEQEPGHLRAARSQSPPQLPPPRRSQRTPHQAGRTAARVASTRYGTGEQWSSDAVRDRLTDIAQDLRTLNAMVDAANTSSTSSEDTMEGLIAAVLGLQESPSAGQEGPYWQVEMEASMNQRGVEEHPSSSAWEDSDEDDDEPFADVLHEAVPLDLQADRDEDSDTAAYDAVTAAEGLIAAAKGIAAELRANPLSPESAEPGDRKGLKGGRGDRKGSKQHRGPLPPLPPLDLTYSAPLLEAWLETFTPEAAPAKSPRRAKRGPTGGLGSDSEDEAAEERAVLTRVTSELVTAYFQLRTAYGFLRRAYGAAEQGRSSSGGNGSDDGASHGGYVAFRMDWFGGNAGVSTPPLQWDEADAMSFSARYAQHLHPDTVAAAACAREMSGLLGQVLSSVVQDPAAKHLDGEVLAAVEKHQSAGLEPDDSTPQAKGSNSLPLLCVCLRSLSRLFQWHAPSAAAAAVAHFPNVRPWAVWQAIYGGARNLARRQADEAGTVTMLRAALDAAEAAAAAALRSGDSELLTAALHALWEVDRCLTATPAAMNDSHGAVGSGDGGARSSSGDVRHHGGETDGYFVTALARLVEADKDVSAVAAALPAAIGAAATLEVVSAVPAMQQGVSNTFLFDLSDR
ncbi:hypothetical protein JKP88DRAFT_287762 [Tribonema minus]|uniref:PDZ domain-containing protein n=1 Tax=Tribonema minus TaxID=303371 RepID=A0A835Z5M4_9STRA|nr:hypothetical protein JKP88DRAFT_287762 [Tribonema minus]